MTVTSLLEPALYYGAPPTASPGAAAELRASLGRTPPAVAPKFLYDARGCALYEAICELDAYYPPRVERAILDRHQAAILARLPRQAEFVDIGSGDGRKARRWLRTGIVSRYIGLDIAEDWLRDCLARGRDDFPGIAFDGVVTDLCWGFQLPVPREAGRPRIFCYPGSSIGNFDVPAACRLLAQMRGRMRTGDVLLLGVDGPTDPARMVRAYDDDDGVTAAFNLNVLNAVGRHLGCRIDASAFRHRAVFDREHSRIEMHLVARTPLALPLGDGRQRRLAAGDWIVTEHSYKHGAERVSAMLRASGFGAVDRFGLPGEGYGVYLARCDDGRS